jgi:hypothetical protein
MLYVYFKTLFKLYTIDFVVEVINNRKKAKIEADICKNIILKAKLGELQNTVILSLLIPYS